LKGFVFDENVPRQLRFQPSLPFTHVAELTARLPARVNISKGVSGSAVIAVES